MKNRYFPVNKNGEIADFFSQRLPRPFHPAITVLSKQILSDYVNPFPASEMRNIGNYSEQVAYLNQNKSNRQTYM